MSRVPSDAAAYIGERIAAYRRQASMTQDQLGAQSGIDSSNLRAYERGRAMPSVYSVLRIAVALGITPAELLDGLTLDLFDTDRPDRRRLA